MPISDGLLSSLAVPTEATACLKSLGYHGHAARWRVSHWKSIEWTYLPSIASHLQCEVRHAVYVCNLD